MSGVCNNHPPSLYKCYQESSCSNECTGSSQEVPSVASFYHCTSCLLLRILIFLDNFCKPWLFLTGSASRISFFSKGIVPSHSPGWDSLYLIAKYSFKLWTPRSPSAASYVWQYRPSLFPPGPFTIVLLAFYFWQLHHCGAITYFIALAAIK